MPYTRWILCAGVFACLLCILFPFCTFSEFRDGTTYAGQRGFLPIWTALTAVQAKPSLQSPGYRPSEYWSFRYQYLEIDWGAMIFLVSSIVWLTGFSLICLWATDLKHQTKWIWTVFVAVIILSGALGAAGGVAGHVVAAMSPYHSPWGGNRATLAPGQLLTAALLCGGITAFFGCFSSVIPIGIGLARRKSARVPVET